METPSGIDSAVPSEFVGAENVSGEFDVRKHHRGTDTEESVHPRSAYQVIPERQTNVEGFFGGDRAYDLSGSTGKPPVLGADDQNRKRKKPGDVEVSVNLDAIQSGDGLSKESLQSMYESQRQQQNPSNWAFQEDLSDMLAQENRKRLRKEEERRRKH
jgi:splicing factor 3B subunit 2